MPLLFKYTAPLLAVWKIEESAEELLSMLDMQAEYIPFLQQINSEKRRQEWLASRVLLKELAGQELLIAYHPDGAPYVPGYALSLSISHTNGYAAVLLQEREVAGVDIEFRSGRVLNIQNRFMSEEEMASMDQGREMECLLIHWCAKETLFKMIRQRDVDFRKQLHVAPFDYKNAGKINVKETRTSKQKCYVLKYEVYPDFVLVYSVHDHC